MSAGNQVDPQTCNSEEEPTPTAGEVFADGSMLELVRDSLDPARTALLHRVGDDVTVAHQIAHGGRRYIPISLDPALLRQLRLPIKDLPHGPIPQLVDQISRILMQTSELSEDDAFMAAVFAVASFFSDCLPTTLCLWLQGIANTEAKALLRVLSWFCWHPLLLVDDGGIGQLPEHLTTTRLVYAPRPSAKLQKLVSNCLASGFGVFHSGSFRESCGAIVIYSGATDVGGACDDTCLRIPVAPAKRLLRPGDEERYHAAVEKVRAKLLKYRLVNYREVRGSKFDATNLTGPIREIARGLGACLVDAPDLRIRLIALLRDQDASVRMERSEEMSPVLEALIAFCHERRTAVHVGDVAKTGNEILSLRGEWATLSPKEAGSKMKLLGFRTVRLDAGGRGLRLTREVRARIHQLARAFGVPATEQGLPGCPDCKRMLKQ